MNAIECPKCKVHASIYSAPRGKVVRNPEAGLKNAVHDDCNACNGSGYIPSVVIDSIVAFARTKERAQEYLNGLRWSYDHFSFNAHGMYIGCEVDGYLHS
jgi:hypothetical protein